MLYPLYVWKDTNSAYGATFPDLPGVNTAADELADLPAMAQDAVETMYDGENVDIPVPTTVDKWKDHPDYKDGFWMMVDIDLTKINSKPVRINISLPENLLHDIDVAAKAQHVTRSGFLAQAALKAMGR
ncbi:type II toxin-antitoxin system HicB family antitoxin [Herbaspirillum sp. GCM10030257]|uniref:type II toxin-antitoxin system HicB family antitoxin n=1 Tax=Herbaspirillum sp. GCM10030257 TaxID=3273393 RepID=UPI0036235379